jgi:hypothetical protein
MAAALKFPVLRHQGAGGAAIGVTDLLMYVWQLSTVNQHQIMDGARIARIEGARDCSRAPTNVVWNWFLGTAARHFKWCAAPG